MISMKDMMTLKENVNWKEATKLNDLWKSDPLFNNYHALSTKGKGKCGEIFVSEYMRQMGSKIDKPTNPGHDRNVDGHKTEIKFSLANANPKKTKIIRDKFMINHVAIGKDWQRFIFCGINPEDGNEHERIRIHWMHKKDFVDYMNGSGEKIFKHQQSGKKGENDDYICTNYNALTSLPFVMDIKEW